MLRGALSQSSGWRQLGGGGCDEEHLFAFQCRCRCLFAFSQPTRGCKLAERNSISRRRRLCKRCSFPLRCAAKRSANCRCKLAHSFFNSGRQRRRNKRVCLSVFRSATVCAPLKLPLAHRYVSLWRAATLKRRPTRCDTLWAPAPNWPLLAAATCSCRTRCLLAVSVAGEMGGERGANPRVTHEKPIANARANSKSAQLSTRRNSTLQSIARQNLVKPPN